MTWARTHLKIRAEDELVEDEIIHSDLEESVFYFKLNLKNVLSYTEEDKITRIPSKKYFYYKMLETLTLSSTCPLVKAYVVCPGFIYGYGEDSFYDFFKVKIFLICVDGVDSEAERNSDNRRKEEFDTDDLY